MNKLDIYDLVREIAGKSGILEATPASKEYTLTPEDLEKMKTMTPEQIHRFRKEELKQVRKQEGRCITCGSPHTKLKTDGTRTLRCAVCLDKEKKKVIDILEKNPELCHRCLKNPHEPDTKLCKQCYDYEESKRKEAKNKGLCIYCKKREAERDEEGKPKKLCTACKDKKLKQQQSRRAKEKSQKDWFGTIQEIIEGSRTNWTSTRPGTKPIYPLSDEEKEALERRNPEIVRSYIRANLYNKRLENHLCTSCGVKVEKDENGNYPYACKKCGKNKIKIRHDRRNVGLCVKCGEPAVKDKNGKTLSLCQKHRDIENYRVLKKGYFRKSQGLCINCGKPVHIGKDGKKHIYCFKHLKIRNALSWVKKPTK